MSFSLNNKRVFVAGHTGMVGSALLRRLQAAGCSEILTISSKQLDLRDQSLVMNWMKQHKPDVIFLAAARVGGILANSRYPAQFIYDNSMIALNVLHAAYEAMVEKVLFLGSTCIYPKLAVQPITEDSLLTGPLEPTNEAYAIAKILGVKICEMYRRQYGCRFIAAMPTNLYGPGDNYDLHNSHVLPALIYKVHEAKTANAPSITVWGTGTPRREFLYVDDLADACVFLMENYDGTSPVNIGTGYDMMISEAAETVCKILKFDGDIVYDTSKPDGTPRKLCDISTIRALGWTAKTDFENGLLKTYEDFLQRDAGKKPQ